MGGTAPVPPIPALPVAAASNNLSLRWAEEFDAPIDFQTGGPTDQGLYRGGGTWGTAYFFREDGQISGPKRFAGSAILPEAALFIDPTDPNIAPTGFSPFVVENSIVKMRTQRRPAILDGLLPDNPETGIPYEWVSGLLHGRHRVYFKPSPGNPVYVESRAKFGHGVGFWSGFIIYGQELNGFYYYEPPFEPAIPWGTDKPGLEIDVAEYQPADMTPFHLNFAGHPGGRPTFGQNTLLGFDVSQAFHRYGVLWTETNLTFFVDDVQVYTHALPSGWVNSYGYPLLAGATVGSSQGTTWAPPAPPGAGPVVVEYDYVRVYGTPSTPFRRRMGGSEAF